MDNFKIDFKLLKKVKEKGFCLCEVEKKEDGSNVCPCSTFLEEKICKCGIYNEI